MRIYTLRRTDRATTTRTRAALVLLGATVLAPSRPSSAQIFGPNLISNGGFESSAISGNFLLRNAGSTALTNWDIGGNSIDQIRGYWTPHSGAQSIDLSGNNAGTITQTVFLHSGPNWKYSLDFWMAGNPQGGSTTKSLNVFFNNGSTDVFNQNTTFSTVGATTTNMGWSLRNFTFTPATTGFYTLRFASNMSGNFGPALDDVSLRAIIPEPATALLALLGLPLLLLRRRLDRESAVDRNRSERSPNASSGATRL